MRRHLRHGSRGFGRRRIQHQCLVSLDAGGTAPAGPHHAVRTSWVCGRRGPVVAQVKSGGHPAGGLRGASRGGGAGADLRAGFEGIRLKR